MAQNSLPLLLGFFVSCPPYPLKSLRGGPARCLSCGRLADDPIRTMVEKRKCLDAI